MKITRRKLIRLIREEHRRLLEVEDASPTPEKDKAFDLISAAGSFTSAQVLDLLYYVIQDIKPEDMADEEAYKKVSNHLMNSTGTVLEPETHPLDTDRDGNIDYSEIDTAGMVFGMPLSGTDIDEEEEVDYGSHIDFTVDDREEILKLIAAEVYDTMDSSRLNAGWLDSLVQDMITDGQIDNDHWIKSAISVEEVRDRVAKIEDENRDITGL